MNASTLASQATPSIDGSYVTGFTSCTFAPLRTVWF